MWKIRWKLKNAKQSTYNNITMVGLIKYYLLEYKEEKYEFCLESDRQLYIWTFKNDTSFQ
jgi:hypothetical protein